MTVTPATQTVSLDGYAVTVTATAAPDRSVAVALACDHAFPPAGDPRRADNVMVWMNGVYVGHAYAPGRLVGQVRGYSGNRYSYSATVPADVLPPGVAPELVVGVWPASAPLAPIVRFVLAPAVPPAQVPKLGGVVVRSLFSSTPDALGPDTLPALAAAGVNCLTFGAFCNPADNAGWDTLAKWEAAWETLVAAKCAAARAAGFGLLLTGDDLMRTPAERGWLDACPWAADAVAYTARRLAEIGGVWGLEVQDEITGGPTSAITKFVGWWKSVPNAPPLGWPYPAVSTPPLPLEDAYGDYRSRFGDEKEWRDGTDAGATVWQQWQRTKRMAVGTGGGKAGLFLLTACGDFYTKQAAGGTDYRPGVDALIRSGRRAFLVPAGVWAGLAAGAVGFRTYFLDGLAFQTGRQTGGVGSQQQTGTRPGDPRWAGLSAAYLSVAAREAALLTEPLPWVEAGGFVLGGRASGLMWAVNLLDTPNPLCPVRGVLLTAAGEVPFTGGPVPPGGVVLTA